jgi:hypothetical protein
VAIKPFTIEQTNLVEHFRNSKHDVVMLDWEGFIDPVLGPKGLFGSLAFWAMPVATAIIADAFF